MYDEEGFSSVCLAHHSSNVNFAPILRLHRGQRGTKLEIVVAPPFDSGILCPDSKSNTVILVVHHVVGHFPSKTRPIFATHTSSRSFTGIFSFRLRDGLIGLLFPFGFGRMDRMENNFRSIDTFYHSLLETRLKPFQQRW